MAFTELNQGAVSFASANWADATGHANGAELRISKPFGPVTAGLDQSASDIAALDITDTARGSIGGAGTSYQVEADTPSGAYVRNLGAVTLYIAAAGTDINNFDFGPRSTNYLTGGTFATVTGSGGVLNVNAGAVVTTLHVTGGSGVIEYNATAITSAIIMGGRWTIKRGVTTLFVGPNAVVYDDREIGGTTSTVNVYGGTFFPVRGNIATVYGYAGVIDCSQAAAPIDLGSTTLQVGGATLLRSDRVDLTNLTRPGAMTIGGAVKL